MKTVVCLFVANIPAMACYGGAIAMALGGADGWGWFLFAGVVCCHGVKSDEEPSRK